MKWLGQIFLISLIGVVWSQVEISRFSTKLAALAKISTDKAKSKVECVVSCNRLLKEGCNAISYNQTTKMCTRGIVATPIVNESELRVAWSSSTSGSFAASFAIDGTEKAHQANRNIFSTTSKDYHPWLAIDLIVTQQVLEVNMINRNNCCVDRTKDVEIRVGKH